MKVIVGVFDTETTGLPKHDGDLDGHRIIEIAISLHVTEDGGLTHRKLGDTWVQRINADRPIHKGAQQVHGISWIDLKDEPKWPEVAPKLAKILSMCDLLVAHNMDFDFPFVYQELELAHFDPADILPDEFVCTMEEGRATTAMGKLPSLKELCWSFGVEYDDTEAHAADYDTDVLAEAFWRGVHWGLYKAECLSQENTS